MNCCLAQIVRELKNAKTIVFVECSFQRQCLVLSDEMGELNVARRGGKIGDGHDYEEYLGCSVFAEHNHCANACRIGM